MSRPSARHGAIAAGHPETVAAAHAALEAGGNAFDAAVAAYLTACVAEPVLASLGGGGFLLAHEPDGGTRLYDFFVHTPLKPKTGEVDFYPVDVDFGATTQEFHIGMGSIATPGGVRGLVRIHEDLCSMPLAELARPAARLAREGVVVNALQTYLQQILEPILTATPAARELFAPVHDGRRIASEGELHRLPEFADFLDLLIREGDRPFHEGDVAARIVNDCARAGGHITADDLRDYEVIIREPLRVNYRDAKLALNPAPSCGGLLIAFGLELLAHVEHPGEAFGSLQHVNCLLDVMSLTNRARRDSKLASDERASERMLSNAFLARYRQEMNRRPSFSRGTTHISVADQQGNLASLSLSNGEGSAYVAPGTGVMLNNMLGEEDLNPVGLQRFRPGQRLASMMCPTIALGPDGTSVALGSGGSNRLRTAILQVLINLLDHRLDVEAAVNSPRLHFERETLNIEPGFPAPTVAELQSRIPRTILWDRNNLFFGGVHAVVRQGPDRFSAGADERRGGASRIN